MEKQEVKRSFDNLESMIKAISEGYKPHFLDQFILDILSEIKLLKDRIEKLES